MKGNSTVFSDLMKPLANNKFKQLVDIHDGDKWSKKYSTWDILINILHGQLTGNLTLRKIAYSQFGFEKQFKTLNSQMIPRSTLSDMCKNKSYEIFVDSLKYLVGKCHKKIKKEMREAIKIIDSTPIQLRTYGYNWAKSNYRIIGLKTHVVFDLDKSIPEQITFSAPNINDIEEGKKIKIEPGTIYCADRAYYDFKWWKKIAELNAIFITRIKSNAAYKIAKRNKIVDKHIKHDWEIKICSKRYENLDLPLRHIRIKKGVGEYITIITNDLKSSASRITNIYKLRWQIELFFKWVKGNLKIKHFISKSENGVKIQIIIAMICYLLIRLAQNKINLPSCSITIVMIIISRHLYAEKPIKNLFAKFIPPDNHRNYQEAMV